MSGTLANQKYGEIPMWNRDRLWKPHLFGGNDEIPMWNRGKLWKCNLLTTMIKFQCGIVTDCGNPTYLATMMEFQCGIEKNVEMQ